MAANPAELLPGAVVGGKYRVERLLGRGGMGAVYLARHELLEQRVALKVLASEAMKSRSASARFLNEAKLAAKLTSEHVCRVSDVGIDAAGMPYIAMEYLDGCDLADLLARRGPLPAEEVCHYVLEALGGVAEAHVRGIVHRDLKPPNLFLANLADGRRIVKVLDFGISKTTDADALRLTSTAALLGSPLYMSPEQVRSAKAVDTRADIWAIGVVMYELLTGTVPFGGDTAGEVFAGILETNAPSVLLRRPDVPPGLAQAVAGCLERRVEARFANVAFLADALLPFAQAADVTRVDTVRGTFARAGIAAVPPVRASSGSLPSSDASGSWKAIVPSGPVASSLANQATANAWGETGSSRHTPKRRRSAVPWFAVGGLAAGALVLVGVVIGLASNRRAAGAASTDSLAASVAPEPAPPSAAPPSASPVATTPMAPPAPGASSAGPTALAAPSAANPEKPLPRPAARPVAPHPLDAPPQPTNPSQLSRDRH